MFNIQKDSVNGLYMYNIEHGICYITTTKNGTFQVITWKNHGQGQRNFMSLRAAKYFSLYCIMKIRRPN